MATSKSSPTPGEAGVSETTPTGPSGGLLDIEPTVVSSVAPDLINPPQAGVSEPQEDVHLKDIEGVRFLGTSDVHILTVRDLANVGVEAKGPLRWDAANDKFVPKSEINADTLHWLASQPDFRAE